MLIRRIILENFGVYGGHHEFDLVPRVKYRRRRSVILFGGKNGAGKTTLLEAVRVALYGKGALGVRVSQKEYESFLRKRIHRGNGALIRPSHAIVGIEFDFVTGGEKSTFLVQRSWDCPNGRTVTEAVTLLRDGEPPEDLRPEHWGDFVQRIVPERLSQLFFFDGDKIKDIAEDDTGPEALADSIKSLLGLDLVDRLKADLAICSSRLAKALSKGRDEKAFRENAANTKAAKAQLKACGKKLAGIETRVDGVQAEVRKREEVLRQEGSAYAKKRSELKEQESAITALIENLQGQLRQECEGQFPLALCPSIAQLLKKQLAAEQEHRKWAVVKDELQDLQRDLGEAIRKASKAAGKREEKEALGKARRIIRDTIRRRTKEPSRDKQRQPVHALSEKGFYEIITWLDSAKKQAVSSVVRLARELEKAERTLYTIRVDLERVPDEAATRPHVEKLGALNQRLGTFRQEKKHLEAEKSRLENELAALERENTRLVETQRQREGTEGRLGLIQTVRTTLSSYRERLTEEKVAMLRRVVADCFNRLCRKGDILHEVEIDPNSFAVTLFDRHRRAIPQEELSAGEKQIFAISLLWGLAKTSGRPLPVIIDTPLARLDSDHRRALIDRYFPYASHQVLVLSTDTEVDQGLFGDLSPHVSHCYHLEFNEAEERTEPAEGYFWKEGVCV